MIWWDKPWNPIFGCTKCSPACTNCYAEALHTQRHKALLAGKKMPECYREPFSTVRFLPERLDAPMHWRKPRRIFVGNMGDLFHAEVQDVWLDRIFAVMACADSRHTFMLCTKRPERMAAYLSNEWLWRDIVLQKAKIRQARTDAKVFEKYENMLPLPNVWLGTTIWDQASADRAVPILLSTPAAKRFVSVEPMLGPVEIPSCIPGEPCPGCCDSSECDAMPDWVICGGETGPGARPMHPDWPRSLRDQCQAAGVPFFFKQWGEWANGDEDGKHDSIYLTMDGRDWHKLPDDELTPQVDGAAVMVRVGTRRAGRVLDGRTWEEVPA